MESLNQFQYGLLTPVLAYVMACIGLGLGLRCIVRAEYVTGVAKRGWLVMAAAAISSGIWTMYLVALLGFAVQGSPIRFDVPLTLASLLAALIAASAGTAAVGYARTPPVRLSLGAIGIGGSVAVLHYTGFSAIHVHGATSYEVTLVALSALIAAGGTALALGVALLVRSARGAFAAALVMGGAAVGTHYIAVAALEIDVQTGRTALPGASAVEFIFPLTVVLGTFLFLSSAFVALSPSREGREAALTDPTALGRITEPAS